MASDGTLKFDTSVDTSGFESGISKLGSVASTGLKAVTGIATAATGAVVAFGASAVQTGLSFDQSMSQIAATLGMSMSDIQNNVNGAGDTFQQLRDKAQQMGAETNFTATEAAEGLNILAMSGYDAAESMDMIEDVLHLAAAGSMDMASAAGYISGTMKGFNDDTKDSAYYADIFAKGATLANTSVEQLGEAMAETSSAAGQYGLSAESTAVALLRLAEQGETGSAAGTALAAVMKNLYTPTNQAAEALAELGVSAYDETGKARDLNDVINDLDASMEGMTDQEKANYKQTIFGIQGLNAYNKMIVTSTDKQEEWTEALTNATGEAAKQYDTMTDNLQGDIDIFNSALDGLKTNISDKLNPAMRSMTQTATDMIGRLADAFKNGGFEGLAAAGGQILTEILEGITEKAPDVINLAVDVIHSFCESLQNSENLGENGAKLLMAIINGIISISGDLAKTAVVLITKLAEGLVNHIGDATDNIIEFITGLGALLVEYAPRLATAAIEILKNLALGIVEHLPELTQTGLDIILGLITALTEAAPELLAAAVEVFSALVQAIPEIIPMLAEALPEIIVTMVGFFVENIPTILDAAIQLFMALVQAIPEIVVALVEAFPQIITAIVTGFGQIGEKVTEYCGQFLSKAVEFLLGINQEIWQFFGTVNQDIRQKLAEILQAALTWGGDMLEKAKKFAGDVVEGIMGFIKELPGKLKEKFDEIIDAITTWGEDLVNDGEQAAEDFVDGVIEFITELPDSILEFLNEVISDVTSWGEDLVSKGQSAAEDLVTAIINAITGLPGEVYSIGADIVSGVWNGIQDQIGWFSSSVSGFFGGIVGNAKSVLGINSPSRVFRDAVGVSIPEGTAAGIERAMPEAIRTTQEEMKRLVSAAKAEVTAQSGAFSIGSAAAAAYERAGAQQSVDVSGTLTSERPVIVNATLKVGNRELAQELAPEMDRALYTIDARNNRGKGR